MPRGVGASMPSEVLQSLKVLVLLSRLGGGGAEKAAASLSYVLAERHDVVFCLWHANTSYSYRGRARTLDLPWNPAARPAEKARRFVVKRRALHRAIREERPDVVLAFGDGPAIVALTEHRMHGGPPVVLSMQVVPLLAYSGWQRWVYAALRRSLFDRAAGIVALSEGVARAAGTQLSIPPERIRVIPNPIDLADVRSRAGLEPPIPLPTDRPVILSVGRLSPEKNHAGLLRAFGSVRERRDAALVIVGEGRLEGELRSLAASLGVEEAVTFAGWQPNPFAFMARATVFVLPSLYEGFGNVLVEAMASGTPVIATNCPFGPADVLQEGRAGLLVPVHDDAAMARAIEDVLDRPELRERLRSAGLRRADDFALAKLGRAYEEELVRAVNAERAPSPMARSRTRIDA